MYYNTAVLISVHPITYNALAVVGLFRHTFTSAAAKCYHNPRSFFRLLSVNNLKSVCQCQNYCLFCCPRLLKSVSDGDKIRQYTCNLNRGRNASASLVPPPRR